MSEVVKSPNRNRPRPVEIRKPEYERLGVSPTAINPSNYARPESLLPIAATSTRMPFLAETVSEVDGASFDQEGQRTKPLVRKDSHIIDNNEFLSFGFSAEKELSDTVESGGLIDLDDGESLEIEKSTIPEVGQYVLMIAGNVVMCDELEVIEEKVKAILYGEDIDFELSEVPQEDIVVLKRVDIQIGVFIKD